MNIECLSRLCQRRQRRWKFWQNRLESLESQENKVTAQGYFVTSTMAAFVISIPAMFILPYGGVSPLGILAVGIFAVLTLGMIVFFADDLTFDRHYSQLVRTTHKILEYHKRQLKQVSEQLAAAEKMATERQTLLDEWAHVPAGAIMPVRLEAELTDRGLSTVKQLQLP